MDRIILEELEKQQQKKKAKFLKLATLCYIMGMNGEKSNNAAVKKKPGYKAKDQTKLLGLKTVDYLG